MINEYLKSDFNLEKTKEKILNEVLNSPKNFFFFKENNLIKNINNHVKQLSNIINNKISFDDLLLDSFKIGYNNLESNLEDDNLGYNNLEINLEDNLGYNNLEDNKIIEWQFAMLKYFNFKRSTLKEIFEFILYNDFNKKSELKYKALELIFEKYSDMDDVIEILKKTDDSINEETFIENKIKDSIINEDKKDDSINEDEIKDSIINEDKKDNSIINEEKEVIKISSKIEIYINYIDSYDINKDNKYVLANLIFEELTYNFNEEDNIDSIKSLFNILIKRTGDFINKRVNMSKVLRKDLRKNLDFLISKKKEL